MQLFGGVDIKGVFSRVIKPVFRNHASMTQNLRTDIPGIRYVHNKKHGCYEPTPNNCASTERTNHINPRVAHMKTCIVKFVEANNRITEVGGM